MSRPLEPDLEDPTEDAFQCLFCGEWQCDCDTDPDPFNDADESL